jgi:hypothetical protein
MLQGRPHEVVTICLYYDCIGLVGTTLQQSLIKSTKLLQIIALLKACSKLADNLEQAVRAQLADRLATIKM